MKTEGQRNSSVGKGGGKKHNDLVSIPEPT